MPLPHSRVGIIGGGRWARVIASVLDRVASPEIEVVLCSPSNSKGWQDWLAANPPRRAVTIEPSLRQLLDDVSVTAVFIARGARHHAETAISALEAGKSVLIEKPFALNIGECNAVVAAAARSKGDSVTGLVFLHAQNLKHFAAACQAAGSVTEMTITWADSQAELRHGETKGYDQSINVLQDVFPHIWSLIRRLIPAGMMQVHAVKTADGGRDVTLSLMVGTCRVTTRIERDSRTRVRRIVASGPHVQGALDFATEPGEAHLNGVDLDVTTGFSSPLGAQILAFLSGSVLPLTRVRAAAEALRLTDDAIVPVRIAQKRAVADDLTAGGPPTRGGAYALLELYLAAHPLGASTITVADLRTVADLGAEFSDTSILRLINHNPMTITR